MCKEDGLISTFASLDRAIGDVKVHVVAQIII